MHSLTITAISIEHLVPGDALEAETDVMPVIINQSSVPSTVSMQVGKGHSQLTLIVA
jgi:hypothetical protein